MMTSDADNAQLLLLYREQARLRDERIAELEATLAKVEHVDDTLTRQLRIAMKRNAEQQATMDMMAVVLNKNTALMCEARVRIQELEEKLAYQDTSGS